MGKRGVLLAVLLVFLILFGSLVFALEDDVSQQGDCEFQGLYFYDKPTDPEVTAIDLRLVDASGNDQTAMVLTRLNSFLKAVGKDEVYIYTFASIEGSNWYNKLLAGRRSAAMKKYIKKNFPLITVKGKYGVGETDYFATLTAAERIDYEKKRTNKAFWVNIKKLVSNRRFIITTKKIGYSNPKGYTKDDLVGFKKLAPNSAITDGCTNKVIIPPPIPIDPKKPDECPDSCSVKCKPHKPGTQGAKWDLDCQNKNNEKEIYCCTEDDTPVPVGATDCLCPTGSIMNFFSKLMGGDTPVFAFCSWHWIWRILFCWLPLLLLFPILYFRRRIKGERRKLNHKHAVHDVESLKSFLLSVLALKKQTKEKVEYLREKIRALDEDALKEFKKGLRDIAYLYDPSSEEYREIIKEGKEHEHALQYYLDVLHSLMDLEKKEAQLIDLLLDIREEELSHCGIEYAGNEELIDSLGGQVNQVIEETMQIEKAIHRETAETGLAISMIPSLLGNVLNKNTKQFTQRSIDHEFDSWIKKAGKYMSTPVGLRHSGRKRIVGNIREIHEHEHPDLRGKVTDRPRHGIANMDHHSSWARRWLNRNQGGALPLLRYDADGNRMQKDASGNWNSTSNRMNWFYRKFPIPHEREAKYNYIGKLNHNILQIMQGNNPLFHSLYHLIEKDSEQNKRIREIISKLKPVDNLSPKPPPNSLGPLPKDWPDDPVPHPPPPGEPDEPKPDHLDDETYIPDGQDIPDDKHTVIDLSPWFLPAKSQDGIGACTAFAVGSIVEYYLNRGAKKLAYEHDSSELFSYYNSRSKKDVDNGSFSYEACDVLKTHGICRQPFWKFQSKPSDRWSQRPVRVAYEEAVKTIITSHKNVRRDPKDWVKILAEHKPLYLAVKAGDNFYDSNGPNFYGKDSGAKIGGHAMVIVGYDSQYSLPGEDKTCKAFKIRNSHGRHWRKDGYVWVAQDVLVGWLSAHGDVRVIEGIKKGKIKKTTCRIKGRVIFDEGNYPNAETVTGQEIFEDDNAHGMDHECEVGVLAQIDKKIVTLAKTELKGNENGIFKLKFNVDLSRLEPPKLLKQFEEHRNRFEGVDFDNQPGVVLYKKGKETDTFRWYHIVHEKHSKLGRGGEYREHKSNPNSRMVHKSLGIKHSGKPIIFTENNSFEGFVIIPVCDPQKFGN